MFTNRSRILVIQDSPELAEMILTTLQQEGFYIHHVDNNEEAINYLSARQPDLILLDLGLPGVSGWDVLSHAREQYNHHIPAIATTAYHDNKKRDTGPLEYVDYYLIKPFTQQMLLEVVTHVLGSPATH